MEYRISDLNGDCFLIHFSYCIETKFVRKFCARFTFYGDFSVAGDTKITLNLTSTKVTTRSLSTPRTRYADIFIAGS